MAHIEWHNVAHVDWHNEARTFCHDSLLTTAPVWKSTEAPKLLVA